MFLWPQTISRITRALVALGIGTLTGATLAVLVVEGRFSALADMIWRVGWIGRRIATAIPGGRGAGFDPLPLAND